MPDRVQLSRAKGSAEHKAWARIHRMSPGPDRARLRSRSSVQMMNACADQWGGWAEEQVTVA